MKSKCVSIVDYGMGNILSVRRAFEKIGFDTSIVQKSKIINSEILVIPGVGSFADAMLEINNNELTQMIVNHVKSGNRLIGICLGMQLLFDTGLEGGRTKGLSLLKGNVKPIPSFVGMKKIRLPNIGWRPISSKFKNKIIEENDFYFVHSYFADINDKSKILATSTYEGFRFPAIIRNENILGMQFHPEKSGQAGLSLLIEIMK